MSTERAARLVDGTSLISVATNVGFGRKGIWLILSANIYTICTTCGAEALLDDALFFCHSRFNAFSSIRWVGDIVQSRFAYSLYPKLSCQCVVTHSKDENNRVRAVYLCHVSCVSRYAHTHIALPKARNIWDAISRRAHHQCAKAVWKNGNINHWEVGLAIRALLATHTHMYTHLAACIWWQIPGQGLHYIFICAEAWKKVDARSWHIYSCCGGWKSRVACLVICHIALVRHTTEVFDFGMGSRRFDVSDVGVCMLFECIYVLHGVNSNFDLCELR